VVGDAQHLGALLRDERDGHALVAQAHRGLPGLVGDERGRVGARRVVDLQLRREPPGAAVGFPVPTATVALATGDQ
jgi:hypothetical protein